MALAVDLGGFVVAGTAGGEVLLSVRSTTTTRVLPKPGHRPSPAPRLGAAVAERNANDEWEKKGARDLVGSSLQNYKLVSLTAAGAALDEAVGWA